MKFIASPNDGLTVTPVMNLKKKGSKTRKRIAMLKLWGDACVYCKEPLFVGNMTFDHVVPKSKGGGRQKSNLVPACQRCNLLRGNFSSVEEFNKVVIETRRIIRKVEKILDGTLKPKPQKSI